MMFGRKLLEIFFPSFSNLFRSFEAVLMFFHEHWSFVDGKVLKFYETVFECMREKA